MGAATPSETQGLCPMLRCLARMNICCEVNELARGQVLAGRLTRQVPLSIFQFSRCRVY